MLLLVNRIVVVDVADAAKKLDAWRQVVLPSIRDRVGIAEFEALVLFGSVENRLLELGVEHERESPEVFFDDWAQFEFELAFIPLRSLVPLQFQIPSQVYGQRFFIEQTPA